MGATVGLWNTITTTYDVYHDNIAAAWNGQQSWGSAAVNVWAYGQQAGIQMVTGPFTDLYHHGKAVYTDVSHGDWEGASEHSYQAAADVASIALMAEGGAGLARGLARGAAADAGAAPTDLHAFGNASGPRAPRAGIDFHVGNDGMVVPQYGRTPLGASTFGDPAQAPLTGVHH